MRLYHQTTLAIAETVVLDGFGMADGPGEACFYATLQFLATGTDEGTHLVAVEVPDEVAETHRAPGHSFVIPAEVVNRYLTTFQLVPWVEGGADNHLTAG